MNTTERQSYGGRGSSPTEEPTRKLVRFRNQAVQRAIDAARSTARRHGAVMFVLLGKTGMFVSSQRHGGELLYSVSPNGHVERERRW